MLPPAFGSGGMLNPPDSTETGRLDPLTRFKLFEHEGPTPKPQTQTQTSRSRKRLRANDDAKGKGTKSSTARTIDNLPLLLASDALAKAVSEVKLPMDGWASPHIFKLLIVLVDPPPKLNLKAIDGLQTFLTNLLVEIGKLGKNGVREFANHCWWALLSKYSTPNLSQIIILHLYSAMRRDQHAAQAGRLGTDFQAA